jgi:hypothetical protein
MIQYSAALMFNSGVTDYWMPAFAGMTRGYDPAFIR